MNNGAGAVFVIEHLTTKINENTMLYQILDRAHSGFRWVVLLLLLAAIFSAFQTWQSGRAGASKMSFYAMTAVHIQLLGGLILYFISPYVKFEGGVMKDAVARFYTVEHISMMLIAVALITIGYSKAKRAAGDAARGKTTFWYYLIGLVVILAAIPWPFRSGLGGNWY